MLGLFYRYSMLTRISGGLALVSSLAFGQFQHEGGASGGGGGGGMGALGSGTGGQMSPMEYVSAVRAINQTYDTEGQKQQSAMVQANNEMAECALKDLENQKEANENYGYGEDGKATGGPSPLMSGLQAALPGLSGPEMEAAMNGRAKQLRTDNDNLVRQTNASVVDFCTQFGEGRPCPSITINSDGQLNGSTTNLMNVCINQKDKERKHDCQMYATSLRADIDTKQNAITRNKTQIGNASGLAMGIGKSLLGGALAYWGANEAQKAQQASDKLGKKANTQQSNLARNICEMNAQQAYDLAKQRLAEINKNRKNALADLGMAASIPGVKQAQNGKGDTDVPVDLGGLGTGPSIAVGDAQNFVNPDAASNLADPAAAGDTPATAAAGGGGSGGGSNAAPSSTFGGGPGPDRAGLPGSPGAKTGTVSGAGSVIPLGSGEANPFEGFGFPPMNAPAENGAGNGVAYTPTATGDGGLLKLLVQARRRYSAHASDLVKSVDVNQIAKNISPNPEFRKISSEKPAIPAKP